MMDEIWNMERDFWLGGSAVFESQLADNCFMALPGVGVLDRQAVIASLAGIPRWSQIEMGARRSAISDSGVVIAYEATGRREGAQPYRALCTSTYLRIG
jgi:hypothetical protein